jgi:hypothetical protein
VYHGSSLQLLCGVPEMGVGGGVRNVSPGDTEWQGRGFTSVHEYTQSPTNSLPFSNSISFISFVLGNANLIESGG